MRADALQNREHILAAADEVFGTKGAAGSTDEVAALAGVGIATVFRHFPTKTDLLSATLCGRLNRLCQRVQDLAQEDESGEALARFFHEIVSTAPSKLAIAEALSISEGANRSEFASQAPLEAGRELRRAIGVLLTKAQNAGSIRKDVSVAEVFALMIGVSRGATFSKLGPTVAARLVDITLDGLRRQRR